MRTHRRHWLTRAIARFLLVATAASGIAAAAAATAGADPSVSNWAKLRHCESTGNYHVIADSGHYGAYQFDIPTWRSVGGHGMPNRASNDEQDYRALYLYRMRGWQPWECANSSHLNLRNDADARSHRKPSRADAAYISGHAAAPISMPKWDGLVYAAGDCSAALHIFQLRMNAIGSPYHFQATGCYYGHTYAAVVALQKANGINPSGRLGPKTWRAAWKGTSPF